MRRIWTTGISRSRRTAALALMLVVHLLLVPISGYPESLGEDSFAGAEASASLFVPADPTLPPLPISTILAPMNQEEGHSSSSQESESASSQSTTSAGWAGTKEILLGLETDESPEASAALSPGRMVARDLSPETEQLLLKTFLRNEVLVLPPQSKERFESRELRDAWEGNLPSITTGFDTVVIRFRKDEESKEAIEKDPEYFDIRLTIREKQLLLQHTEGRTRRSKEGLELAFPPLEQERLYIDGRGRSGMTVLLPRIQLGGQYARALLLCPRVPFNVERGARRPDDTFFVESPYKVSRTLYSARGHVEGRALSGGGVGLAKAEILTTPNVARSKAWEDSSYGVDPTVALTYLPFTSEQLADVEQDGSVVAAIEGRLTLQRPAGFKRVSSQRILFWLKEFALSNEQPWFIRIRGDRPPARVAPGRCYSVLLERFSEQRYTREELVLPERLKEPKS